MTIDEAIRRLTAVEDLEMMPWMPKAFEAYNLGLEALKFVKADRVKYPYVKVPLLPGETEE